MVRSESDQIHVLVVDDDPYAIEFLLGDLRADSDIALSVVNNVDDAILHLKQHQVNVAVIDKMMPAGGLDFMITRGGFHTGIALAQIIRREYSSTKIISIR